MHLKRMYRNLWPFFTLFLLWLTLFSICFNLFLTLSMQAVPSRCTPIKGLSLFFRRNDVKASHSSCLMIHVHYLICFHISISGLFLFHPSFHSLWNDLSVTADEGFSKMHVNFQSSPFQDVGALPYS